MNAFEFTESVQEILDDGCMEGITRTGSFESEGVLTTNAGLAVRLGDGSEFQITVVQSRYA